MDLTSENFTRLLGWLDPNPEAAGQEYVRIRADLTRKFTSQHCVIPDKLADLTIDRVASILTPELIQDWEGAKERYFYRVAYYVFLEWRATYKYEEVELPLDLVGNCHLTDDDLDLELALDCLDKCVEKLPTTKQELIITYYHGKKAVKIKNRKELARKLNLELPVLRVQALRIRKGLKSCMEECLEKKAGRNH